MVCFVLFCFVLYCFASYCIVLLYFIVLYCIVFSVVSSLFSFYHFFVFITVMMFLFLLVPVYLSVLSYPSCFTSFVLTWFNHLAMRCHVFDAISFNSYVI